jgi:formate hydrogenlyase subunit 3/multisubunit Na+/H+ antiporter MnhD subunit
MNWFGPLFYQFFYNVFGVIASPTVAIITLVATVYSLRTHRDRSNLWWIIACAIVSLLAFVITGLILYTIWSSVHGVR